MGQQLVRLAVQKVPGSLVEKDKGKRKKGKGKRKRRIHRKRKSIQIGCQKMTVLGGPKEASSFLRKVKIDSLKVVTTLTTQKRMQAGGTKGRGMERKGKSKLGACPQYGFSDSEAPSEESNSQSWKSELV